MGTRDAASYGRDHFGAFLPETKSGSGSDDHDLGGGGFARSCLTPLKRVTTISPPGGASLFLKGAIHGKG